MILDANERIGDSWRNRWDSLRLFTPARYDALPGMPFPAHWLSFPTKDAMADYLETYAARFRLPVYTGTRVDRLSKRGDVFVIQAGGLRLQTDNVIVAMSSYQSPKIPRFAAELAPHVRQIHSLDYRNPSQLQSGDVLVVGAGNSGAEIALDVRRAGHEVSVSGRHPGHVPFDTDALIPNLFITPILFRLVFHRLLTVDTPMGRKARAKMIHHGGPLVRTKPRTLSAAGVQRVPRMAGVRGGRPLLEDGRTLDVSNVIWCTGFTSGFSWIDLPVFDDDGEVSQRGGIAVGEPGLGFVGQHFQYALSSTMIHGIARDAKRVVDAIAVRPIRAQQRESRAVAAG